MFRARFDVTRMKILERTVCLGYYSRHYTCDHTFYACFVQHAIHGSTVLHRIVVSRFISLNNERRKHYCPSNYVFISISCSWGVLFSNCIHYKLKNCCTFTVLKTIQIQFFWNNQTDGSGVHLVIASSCVGYIDWKSKFYRIMRLSTLIIYIFYYLPFFDVKTV